ARTTSVTVVETTTLLRKNRAKLTLVQTRTTLSNVGVSVSQTGGYAIHPPAGVDAGLAIPPKRTNARGAPPASTREGNALPRRPRRQLTPLAATRRSGGAHDHAHDRQYSHLAPTSFTCAMVRNRISRNRITARLDA